MTALKDTPGGAALINSCIKAVSNLALGFVGESDDKVLDTLEALGRSLAFRLEEHFGAETAAAIAEALIGAVMGHKHELEAKGTGSA